MMNTLIAKAGLAAGCLLLAGAGMVEETEHNITPAQVVALDECDPATFNLPGNAGPGFCKNVALGYTGLGYTTTFSKLIAEAASPSPDPKWDFEPDNLTVKEGTPIIAVNQGGEPHTFTEVANFGGGFVPPLNGGEDAVPECAAGFSSVAVARTRILQGSQLQVAGLSKGVHHFQCCIHPWMRMTVVVK
jgi:plastocyanin